MRPSAPHTPAPRWSRWSGIAVVAALVAMAAAVVPARGADAAPASRSCGWAMQFSPDKLNLFYPDEGATYWAAILPIPIGGSIQIQGDYPYARYMSFTTYTLQTQAIDGLNDQLIAPDPGSVNPFLVGAQRQHANRRYTVSVLNQRIPSAGRAPNTLYTESADGSKTTKALQGVAVVLRVYAPDEGLSLAGGVPLPTLSLVSALGGKTTLPTCPDPVPSTDLSATLANMSGPTLPVAGLFAQNPPHWRKYTNLATAEVGFLLDNALFGTTLLPTVQNLTDQLLPSGGFFENPDNKYIAATLDQAYGEVLVIRGKAPRTPHTRAGQPTMGAGDLRYWSLCVENAQTTAFYGCAFDEQVPLDDQGYYTVAVSTRANRPDNATKRCGVTWLPAGPTQQALLILRNMLPAPDFAEAIQFVAPDHEREQMGEYYPAGSYTSASDFESRGC